MSAYDAEIELEAQDDVPNKLPVIEPLTFSDPVITTLPLTSNKPFNNVSFPIPTAD